MWVEVSSIKTPGMYVSQNATREGYAYLMDLLFEVEVGDLLLGREFPFPRIRFSESAGPWFRAR